MRNGLFGRKKAVFYAPDEEDSQSDEKILDNTLAYRYNHDCNVVI